MRPLRVLAGAALLPGAIGACTLDARGIPGASSSSSSSTSAAAGPGGSGGVGASGSVASSASAGGATSSSSGTGGAGGAGAGGSGMGGAGGIVPVDCQGSGEFYGGPSPTHCYLFVQKPPMELIWYDARLACQAWHGNADLAALSSKAEYDFVVGAIGAGNADTWIGGWDPVGSGDKANFEWSNGEPWDDDGWVVGDAPWKGGEPSTGDDRLKIKVGFEGKAYTQTVPNGYLCERP